MADLVDDIYSLLGGAGNPNNGVTYGLSNGNNWEKLLATPDLWGHNPAVNDYEPTAKNLTDAIKDLIAGAEYSVDISTLASNLAPSLPDGRFLDAIRDGLEAVAKAGRKIVVRVLVGVYYPMEVENQFFEFLSKLKIPDGIPVYMGAMQSGWFSWNHSKLVIVDGGRAISGGHNQWSSTYCGFAPVHDVSIQLSGPAVAVAQSFLNLQWTAIARYSRTEATTKWFWTQMRLNKRTYANALPRIQLEAPAPTGSTRVLALARMGAKLVPPSPSANASRTARIAAVKRAKQKVRLSQQMLGKAGSGLDEEFFHALCTKVAEGKDVTIIISDKGASDASHTSYSGYGVKETAELIGTEVGRITGKSGTELAKFLQAHVHVGPVRIYDKQSGDPESKSWKWRNDANAIEPANHAKVYIIDDEAFYVGSDNAYPIFANPEGLQEFGFLVSGQAETQKFVREYWDKFWSYSSQFQYADWEKFVTLKDGVPA